MYNLILDSSTQVLYVAVTNDNEVLFEKYIEGKNDHAKNIVFTVDEALKAAGIDSFKLDRVIVGFGPGSYTGVRIAITIAKTMATALDAKLYAVSSLRVLKDQAKPSICLINARSGRSYIGVYEGTKTLLEDQIMKNEDVLKYIEEHPNYSVCGETKYLDIDGIISDNIQEMLSLKESLDSLNPLSLKPVYMKEEYAKPIY